MGRSRIPEARGARVSKRLAGDVCALVHLLTVTVDRPRSVACFEVRPDVDVDTGVPRVGGRSAIGFPVWQYS